MARKKRAFKPSLVDNLIGVFSPRAKARRLKFKAYSDQLVEIKRKYEGADSGRRTGGWITTGSSGNTEVQGALLKLRNRSRDLVRNNPYAKRGMRVIANNTVGARGIATQIKVDNNRSTSETERKLNGIWRAWSRTTACHYEKTQEAAFGAGICNGEFSTGFKKCAYFEKNRCSFHSEFSRDRSKT